MEDKAGLVGTTVFDADVDRCAAVGAHGVDRAVRPECGADPEGVPPAVGVPRTSGRLHSEAGGLSSEGIGHPNVAGTVEYKRMGLVQALPTGPHVALRNAGRVGDLGDRRSPSKLDEAPIGRVPQQDIRAIHDETVPIGALVVNCGLDPALERGRHSGYRRSMTTGDSDETKPLGFSIDIGEILKDVAGTRRRTTRRRTTRASTTDMDAALRRAVRAELVDVERALKLLATEVVRLRRANEDLADKVAKLTRR